MGYGGGGSGGGGSGGSGGSGASGGSGGSGYRRVGEDRTANLKVNNITNRTGTDGTDVDGVVEVNTTAHFIPPSGNTFRRVVSEGVWPDNITLYYDPSNPDSYLGNESTPSSLSSGSTLNDLANNFHKNATITGATFDSTLKALLITDSSDFIDTDAGGAAGEGSVEGGQKYTFEGWFKFPDEHRTSADLLFGRYDSNAFGAGGYSLRLFSDTETASEGIARRNTLMAFIATTSDNRSLTQTPSRDDFVRNKWVHITHVFDGSLDYPEHSAFYIDGVKQQTIQYGGSFTTAHTSMPTHVPGPTFKIGRITDSGGNHTGLNNVHVGKFSVYDTALTAEQVVQNYRAHQHIYSNS